MQQQDNKKKVLDMSVVAKIADNVEIGDITIIDMEAERKREDFFDEGPIRVEQKYGATGNSSEKNLVVFSHFELQGIRNQDREDPDFTLKATFKISYYLHDPIQYEQEEINMFSNSNGIYNAWPFWREFVHSTTQKMGFPGLTVPLFKIPKSPDRKPSPKTKSKSGSSANK